jgi:transcription factor SFP1
LSTKKQPRDLYFSWHKKQDVVEHRNVSFRGPVWESDDELADPLFVDESDHDATFPLFPTNSPPASQHAKEMAETSAAPIDISLPPRLSNSQSPRNQTSTLTSALQEASAAGENAPDSSNTQYMTVPDLGRLSVSGRHDSISNLFSSSYLGSGARPISTQDRSRRESNTGGSFMGNGMSWGGISVGSLRDEYVYRIWQIVTRD